MSKSKSLTIPALFTALIVILSQISIPIQPIPFTFSLLAIFLTAALLPPKQAFLSVFTYVMLGIIGLPVFAGFRGGLNIILGFTGGFIMAYPLMALVIALMVKLGKNKNLSFTIIGMLIALVICYLMGCIWYMIVAKSSFSQAFSLCVAPFILFDIIKICIAFAFSVALRKAIPTLAT
ncbi:MAG: biotin transporter BioY [Clostridiales bacterium]|nr:biotin transporter BioY [Clostridiales bacterium]